MSAYVTSVQQRANSNQTALAVQYKEISRRPGKFAPIVERNTGQLASMFGKVITHELTLPNGTKEGRPVFMVRLKGRKLTMELGDWLVVENEEFKVLKPEEFGAMYAHLV